MSKSGNAAAKAKSALSEIKANFKADEGTTGFPKIKSMFVNLWKSGVAGKCALTACALIVLCLISPLFLGCGAESDDLADASGNTESKEVSSRNSKEPSVKGLRLGMSYNEAIEACNKLISGKSDFKLKEYSEFGRYSYRISIVYDTRSSFTGACYLWFKGEGEERKVGAIEFKRFGLGVFFNSADLKGEEFCRMLVKNYSWIGDMEGEVEYTGSGTVTRWKYMSSNGYKVIVTEEGREITFGLYAIATEASRKFD